ncbi:MAG: TatD family hydrolase [Flavobacteriaceae bacterium]|nr:TatD family hydrolase [Flavobacteriaceae bacterium]MDZ4146711.1 TatD family hydrolase [Flavobacteriaceae bacterium]
MNLTDTHTHLYSEAFDEDRDEAIQKAISQGVSRFFLPAIDASYIPKMLQLKKNYPENIYLMAGLHPTHVKENYLEELDAVEKMLDKHACIAVGETGIDLYWAKTFLTQQQDAFQKQIRLAKQRKLPIVIHCRDAFEEVFEVLEAEKSEDLYGIFHCFTGTLEQAQRAISLKMKLGIGGVVTFKNGKLDQFLNEIDLNQIVLETDSPYLAPAPHRGKRNESSYLNLVCQKVAEIYGKTPEEIANQTSANADAIFRV